MAEHLEIFNRIGAGATADAAKAHEHHLRVSRDRAIARIEVIARGPQPDPLSYLSGSRPQVRGALKEAFGEQGRSAIASLGRVPVVTKTMEAKACMPRRRRQCPDGRRCRAPSDRRARGHQYWQRPGATDLDGAKGAGCYRVRRDHGAGKPVRRGILSAPGPYASHVSSKIAIRTEPASIGSRVNSTPMPLAKSFELSVQIIDLK